MDKIIPYDMPAHLQVDLNNGDFTHFADFFERRLSHLADLFSNQAAVEAELLQGDPLLYDVRRRPFITSLSDWVFAVTRIYPGTIGGEYFMTKGHFHLLLDQPEIYFCLQGRGCLLLETAEADFHAHWWTPGSVSHIPPGYAHRTVNIGNEPLVFTAIYRLAAGHDYAPIAQHGFTQLLVERNGEPELVPNPNR